MSCTVEYDGNAKDAQQLLGKIRSRVARPCRKSAIAPSMAAQAVATYGCHTP